MGLPAELAAFQRLTLSGDASQLPFPTTSEMNVRSDLSCFYFNQQSSPALRVRQGAGPAPPPRRRPQRQERGAAVLRQTCLSVRPSTSDPRRRGGWNTPSRGLERGSGLSYRGPGTSPVGPNSFLAGSPQPDKGHRIPQRQEKQPLLHPAQAFRRPGHAHARSRAASALAAALGRLTTTHVSPVKPPGVGGSPRGDPSCLSLALCFRS